MMLLSALELTMNKWDLGEKVDEDIAWASPCSQAEYMNCCNVKITRLNLRSQSDKSVDPQILGLNENCNIKIRTLYSFIHSFI